MSTMSTLRKNHIFLINISIVLIPKSTVLVIIFRVLMLPLSLINAGPQSIINFQCKKKISSGVGFMDDRIPSSSYGSAVSSMKKKNRRATFKMQIKNINYLLRKRTMHCLGISKKTCLCTEEIKGHARPCSGHNIYPAT